MKTYTIQQVREMLFEYADEMNPYQHLDTAKGFKAVHNFLCTIQIKDEESIENGLELVRMRWWVQDTDESGYWAVSGLVGIATARSYYDTRYYHQMEIVLDEDGWPLYQGNWTGVLGRVQEK